MTHRPRLLIFAMVPLTAAIVVAFFALSASAQSSLPKRGVAIMVAADGIAGSDNLPPPDPSYCAPADAGGGQPPNAIFGTLTISGAAAPVGTLVQSSFDGKVGPASRVREAGGYRVLYNAGGAASCSNKVGANISILVNGVPFATGVKVGDGVANPILRFDIVAP